MRKLRAESYTTYTSVMDEHREFIKYLTIEFAKYELYGAFNLPKGYEGNEVVFADTKQQFLYELKGGKRLYRQIREAYMHWQEQELVEAMSREIAREIDKQVLEDLLKAAEGYGNTKRLNNIP